MSWEIEFDHKQGIVRLVYAENVTSQELLEAFNATVNLCKNKNTGKIIADCTKMTGGHSVKDLYILLSKFDPSYSGELREAILVSNMSLLMRQSVKFYETACIASGLKVKVFENREKAMEWLLA